MLCWCVQYLVDPLARLPQVLAEYGPSGTTNYLVGSIELGMSPKDHMNAYNNEIFYRYTEEVAASQFALNSWTHYFGAVPENVYTRLNRSINREVGEFGDALANLIDNQWR